MSVADLRARCDAAGLASKVKRDEGPPGPGRTKVVLLARLRGGGARHRNDDDDGGGQQQQEDDGRRRSKRLRRAFGMAVQRSDDDSDDGEKTTKKKKKAASGEKRKGKKKKDPAAPKGKVSAFLYFSKEKRAEVKAALPDAKPTDVSRELGKRWRDLGDSEKEPYAELASQDAERYDREMAD
ncbi:MAG: HMG-box domain-containing protein, partial [Planctomycetota bacterium]